MQTQHYGAIGYARTGHGGGLPIVFLHGVGSDKSVWRPQLGHFGSQRPAIAFDYPGYGDSDPAPKGTSRDDYAAAIFQAMDGLGIGRAHICGLSLGGVIAIAMHEADPQRCASLTLADTFAVRPDGRGIYDRSIAGSADMRAFAEARVDFLLAQPADPQVRQEVIETMARIDPAAYRIGAEAVWLADQRPRVRKIFVPTLILCGDQDKPTPPALSEQLHRLIPKSELRMIAGAGHLTNLESPTEFNRIVGDFIGGLNESFVTVRDWREAARYVTFKPKALRAPAKWPLKNLSVHLRDYKGELSIERRTIEAYHEAFIFTQSHRSPDNARNSALETLYGQNPQPISIAGHEGRMYELGPEVPADDIDGRSASVIVWNEGPKFYFFASGKMTLAELLPIAKRFAES